MKRLFFPILWIFMLLSCEKGSYRQGPPDDIAVYADSVAYYRTEGRNLRNSGRYNEALTLHRRGLELAEEVCDTLEVIQALNNIGTVYRRMGLLDDAASWHYRALTWCEEWSDSTSTVSLKNRVVSLNGIGNVHLSMGNDDIAMESFREALKGESRLGSATGQAINHANIGALFEKKGRIDSARHHYTLSLKFNEESGNVLGMGLCANHFGRLAENEGDYAGAFREYEKAYGLLKGGTDAWHLLQSSTSLSRVSLKIGRYDHAEHYLDEAMDMAESIGSLAHLADIYNQKYTLEKLRGNYRQALRWLEKAAETSGSLAEERSETEIYELRSEYEKEKNRTELRHLRQMHQQEVHRNRMLLVSVLVILFLAAVGIAVLVYALWLRSRNHKMLKELDQTRNNYFTVMAHEFRTPLTVIMAAARSLGANASDEVAVKEDSKDILVQSQELMTLVNQILEVAKMTSGIAPAPVWRRGDVAAYVASICGRYGRYALEKEVRIVCESAEIEMDFVPDMILRIVRNLLSNAIKYSKRGTVVTVRMQNVKDRGMECFRMDICDNGIGMSRQQVENVFKPFYTADSGVSDMSTGVGMSVVKLAVETMDGSIHVHSVQGEGSEFTILIPVRHDKAVGECPEFLCDDMPAAENACVVHPGEVDQVQDTEFPRILIVEDKPEVARWEMRQLEGAYSFYYASDGAEGLRKAEEIVPDLIITDVMMPVMDGLEFCRKVRSSELLSHVPVIMVTAKAEHEDRLKGLEAGADAYLEKPYDENELSVRVRMLLEQRSMLRSRFASGGTEVIRDLDFNLHDKAFLDRFSEALDKAFANGKVDCEELASDLCIGRVQLNRKMKAITGLKTTEYILNVRISKAKTLLETTDLTIGEVALKCGVEDVGYFSTLFRKNTGMTPSAWRKK